MIVSVEGFVAGCTDCGESDKMLTLITRRYGKMSVYCRGGRKINSKFMAASLKFCYGDYVINKTDKLNILQEANAKMTFFGLRKSIASMALADYMAEVLSDVTMPEEPDETALDLVLNCLFVLSGDKRDHRTVKTAFEWKMIKCLGLSPDLSSCAVCGKKDDNWYYLDIMNDSLLCRQCGNSKPDGERDEGGARIVTLISAQDAKAAQTIMNSDKKHTFCLPEDEKMRKRLSEISEKYLLNHLERGYKTLDFYKEVSEL